MWQVALVIAMTLFLFWLFRYLLRTAVRNRARKAFTDVMSLVHDWSIKRNDLDLTARASAKLSEHHEQIRLAQEALNPETETETGLSWREREFRLEYGRCEARHREVMNLNYPDNDMYEQAMELQEAIDSLESKRSSVSGGTGDD